MKQRSRQLLFTLLSVLMLGQSVAATADQCLNYDAPQAIELAESLCQYGCCGMPEPTEESCYEQSGCNGYCHSHCLCHDLFITFGITPPMPDISGPLLLSSEYRFIHYNYTDPEPQTLLRPPCA